MYTVFGPIADLRIRMVSFCIVVLVNKSHKKSKINNELRSDFFLLKIFITAERNGLCQISIKHVYK